MDGFGKRYALSCKKFDENIRFIFAKYFKIDEKESDLFLSHFFDDECRFSN